MTQRNESPRTRDILTRWCAIAEQRLDHLTELYESGRWRRYHSELSFMENIREAKTAVETWQALARREATLDNAAVDSSWLDRPAGQEAPPMQHRIEQSPARALGMAAVHAVLASVLAGHDSDGPGVASGVAPGEQVAPEAEPNPVAARESQPIQERYPLLHNAL